MATWEEVRRLAFTLPETDERLSRGLRQWRVKDKHFVWERPLRGPELIAEAWLAGAPKRLANTYLDALRGSA